SWACAVPASVGRAACCPLVSTTDPPASFAPGRCHDEGAGAAAQLPLVRPQPHRGAARAQSPGAGIPAIYVTAGPMLRGSYRGQPAGSGTDLWRLWDDVKAGVTGDCELADLEYGIARPPGHCMTMGTASTMTSAAEALGMTLPGMASIPAVDSAHYRMAAASGQRIVDMVWEDLTPDKILTREAFEDAVATVLALGGSTNAFIHLIAMAGRAGAGLTLDDFNAHARPVPRL